ncbi:S41 family peptidase [Clostridiaceae bacterium Marseille-Q4143]|nr:S41 family peptidase [Clostridiaceae bacterium Marseille-Q4143]
MEENRKHHSFRKGLICGVLISVLTVSVCGCGAAWMLGHLGFTALTSGGNAEEQAKISTKMQELQSYIDRFYLFDYDEENVESGIYKGMMAGLGDVYTNYYTPEEYASFMESSNGSYSGIGAMLSQDYNTGIITVVKVFEGSPAAEAGVQPDDILYKVKGEEVTGMDLNLVVSDLKGEEGTDVEVSFMRGTDVLDLTLTRRSIEVPTVEYRLITDKIGYISISEFDDVTDDQFIAALDDLNSQGMENLIIDLRDNGGGLVDVTCDILDQLLPEGLIVYTEDKDGNREEETSDAEHYFPGKMAVLVNGNSASASEIFAGAIKDYGVGTLIGTQTFGKGIVQSLFPLSDGSAIKVTVSRYYTPAGNNIHEVGITPDIILEKDTESEEDNQLQKAIDVLKE